TRRAIGAFRGNVRANVAITFGIAAVPILGAVACALDYSMAMSIRTKLQAAADAATLAAISANSPLVATALNMSRAGNVANDSPFLTTSCQSGAPTSPAATIQAASVSKSGNTLTATVSFSAQVPTAFLKIMGYQNLNITGTSTASYAIASFIDF